MLIPPDNFGMVEPGFYRASKLEADHLPFLETLQLKSLVLLDVAKPPRTLKSFLHENNVDLYNLGGLKISNHQNTGSSASDPDKSDKAKHNSADSASGGIAVVSLQREKTGGNDSWMIIEKNVIAAALEIVLDRQKHSVLVVDSSSALVGILRKIQKWNFNSIVNEYRIYTGNASKISYNVEVFLELIQLELVPSELHQALKRRDEIADSDFSSQEKKAVLAAGPRKLSSSHFAVPQNMAFAASPRSRRESVDDPNSAVYEDGDSFSAAEYEDDVDDELLSASPQIPANLLKLVEQRKQEAPSPGTSPDFRQPSVAGGRANSMEISPSPASLDRRRSSVESRYLRANHSRFRDAHFTPSPASPRRMSLDTSLRQFRLDQEKNSLDEIQKIRDKLGYSYYQPMGASADGFNVIKIRIPAEQNLAPWFVKARSYWESLQRK